MDVAMIAAPIAIQKGGNRAFRVAASGLGPLRSPFFASDRRV